MDDALVLSSAKNNKQSGFVLILVVMDDALVPFAVVVLNVSGLWVLILVVMDDALVLLKTAL